MTITLQNDINRFTGYFKNQVEEIASIESGHSELYRRLLYASLLDTLAGTVMPRRLNRERFVHFVKRFCHWSDGNKVSLSHLVQLLRKNPDPAFEKLRKWAISEFKDLSVHAGRLMLIDEDPCLDLVKKNWPVQKEHRTPIEGIDLVALQHYQLLYHYRNTLVHELRTPGKGMEFGVDDLAPFYHLMSTVDDNLEINTSSIELVYPWRFLKGLCETALEELQKYYSKNEINPYDSLSYGTYWIRELNN